MSCRAFGGKFLPPFVISSFFPLPKWRRARTVFPVRFVWSGMGRGGEGGRGKNVYFCGRMGLIYHTKMRTHHQPALKKSRNVPTVPR